MGQAKSAQRTNQDLVEIVNDCQLAVSLAVGCCRKSVVSQSLISLLGPSLSSLLVQSFLALLSNEAIGSCLIEYQAI